MARGVGAQQEAVARRCGTSLAVTVINASAGLIAHWGTAQLDWGLTTTSAIATVGAAFPAVDTVTLVGYMTNNCILASAVEGEGLEPTTEVLSDATGAINIANDAGFAPAETVHRTIKAVLNSNLAAVATTEAWTEALSGSTSLPQSDLGSSAIIGAQRAADA